MNGEHPNTPIHPSTDRDRYHLVRAGWRWNVMCGEGTGPIWRCFRWVTAARLAARLNSAFCDGQFVVKRARDSSPVERLHRLCDGISEQANESPFTREEWDAIDKQTVRLQNGLRGLIDAVRNVEIEKRCWDLFVALPLQNAYRALKHQDPLTQVEPLESRQSL